MGWGEGARVGRGGAGAHMCSRGCCCWSANDVWRCRLRKLSLGDLGLVSENAPWRLADLADVTLCKSPSLGRVAMVETGLESGCGRGEVSSAFNLRLASRRVDWRSWVFSSLSLLDRLSRARLWWNMPRRCTVWCWSEPRLFHRLLSSLCQGSVRRFSNNFYISILRLDAATSSRRGRRVSDKASRPFDAGAVSHALRMLENACC